MGHWADCCSELLTKVRDREVKTFEISEFRDWRGVD